MVTSLKEPTQVRCFPQSLAQSKCRCEPLAHSSVIHGVAQRLKLTDTRATHDARMWAGVPRHLHGLDVGGEPGKADV